MLVPSRVQQQPLGHRHYLRLHDDRDPVQAGDDDIDVPGRDLPRRDRRRHRREDRLQPLIGDRPPRTQILRALHPAPWPPAG